MVWDAVFPARRAAGGGQPRHVLHLPAAPPILGLSADQLEIHDLVALSPASSAEREDEDARATHAGLRAHCPRTELSSSAKLLNVCGPVAARLVGCALLVSLALPTCRSAELLTGHGQRVRRGGRSRERCFRCIFEQHGHLIFPRSAYRSIASAPAVNHVLHLPDAGDETVAHAPGILFVAGEFLPQGSVLKGGPGGQGQHSHSRRYQRPQ
jgi:hypothetical protein